jgi:hypothetical protein
VVVVMMMMMMMMMKMKVTVSKLGKKGISTLKKIGFIFQNNFQREKF